MTTDEVRKARIEAIYKEDEGRELRKSHDNPAVKAIYEEFLGRPLGERSHYLLHTKYTKKDRYNPQNIESADMIFSKK